MSKILVLYATRDGHTKRVAEYLTAAVRSSGSEAGATEAIAIDNASLPAGFSLAEYAAAIVVAPVPLHLHGRNMAELVRRHLRELDRIPTAYVAVSLSQTGDGEAVHETFLRETGWVPALTRRVAADLRGVSKTWMQRLATKHLSGKRGAKKTARGSMSLDWSGLDLLAEELSALIRAKKTAADSRPALSEPVLQ